MVRLTTLNFSVALLSCTSALSHIVVKRDATQVLTDFKTLTPQVSALINATQAFPNVGGTLNGFELVHANVIAVVNQIETTTADIKAIISPVIGSDCGVVNASYSLIEPSILTALKDYVSKESAFLLIPETIAIQGTINSDVSSLNSSNVALASAVVGLCIIL